MRFTLNYSNTTEKPNSFKFKKKPHRKFPSLTLCKPCTGGGNSFFILPQILLLKNINAKPARTFRAGVSFFQTIEYPFSCLGFDAVMQLGQLHCEHTEQQELRAS